MMKATLSRTFLSVASSAPFSSGTDWGGDGGEGGDGRGKIRWKEAEESRNDRADI